MSTSREQDLVDAIVALSTALVTGADVVAVLADLTADSARLLDITSAGLLLADGFGSLHVMATTSSAAHDLEVHQTQSEQGPCLDSYRTGRVVAVPDLDAERDHWPTFTAVALDLGLLSVHAVPLRLRGHRLGALGLFGSSTGSLSPGDLALGQAIADVASVVVVQNGRPADDQEGETEVSAQLHAALTARAVVEQARGVLSYSGGISTDAALQLLRGYAADTGRRLSEVADDVVHRRLAARTVLDRGLRGPVSPHDGR